MFCAIQEYFKYRVETIDQLRQQGVNPFPHKFHVDTSLTDFIAKYSDIADGVIREDVIVSVAGS